MSAGCTPSSRSARAIWASSRRRRPTATVADWLHRLVDELDANRHLLADLVAEHLPGARLVVPESTYLAWLDLTGVGLGDDPAGEVLRRARVALSPGPIFGSGGRGHARINYATSPEILRDAVGRIASILE